MGTSKTQSKLNQIFPDSLMEITESSSPKFLIKFSSVECTPCQNLQRVLDTEIEGILHEALTVYHVDVQDDTTKVYSDLKKFFSFRTLPYCVVTNSSLDTLDSMSGFKDSDTFKAFVLRNFE